MARAEAWPQRLEARTGCGSATSSWAATGRCSSLRLGEWEPSFAPEFVRVGFCMGSDVFAGDFAVSREHGRVKALGNVLVVSAVVGSAPFLGAGRAASAAPRESGEP